MMCLTVNRSIQPTSRATGIDDDMGGNDKLTTSQTLDRTGIRGIQHDTMQPGQFSPVTAFMTSLRADCTCREPEKQAVCPQSAVAGAGTPTIDPRARSPHHGTFLLFQAAEAVPVAR